MQRSARNGYARIWGKVFRDMKEKGCKSCVRNVLDCSVLAVLRIESIRSRANCCSSSIPCPGLLGARIPPPAPPPPPGPPPAALAPPPPDI